MRTQGVGKDRTMSPVLTNLAAGPTAKREQASEKILGEAQRIRKRERIHSVYRPSARGPAGGTRPGY